jgi:hypothetical protein
MFSRLGSSSENVFEGRKRGEKPIIEGWSHQ